MQISRVIRDRGRGVSLTAINLFACLRCITPLRKTDKRESLGPLRVPIFGQEYSRDASEALEDSTEIVVFGEFRDLRCKVFQVRKTKISHVRA